MGVFYISDANTGNVVPIKVDDRGFLCVKCDAMSSSPVINIPPITVPPTTVVFVTLLKSGFINPPTTQAVQLPFNNLPVKRIVLQSPNSNTGNPVFYIGTQVSQDIEIYPGGIYTFDCSSPVYIKSSSGNKKLVYHLFG